MRILVVDDDRDIRESLRELLAEAGYAVAVAENGRVALERLRAGLRPGVILLDLMMPIMDGMTFRADHARMFDLGRLHGASLVQAGLKAHGPFTPAELATMPAHTPTTAMVATPPSTTAPK